MLRTLVLILILLPTISNADQGLKISCLNMKSILGKKYEPLKLNEKVGLTARVIAVNPILNEF